MSSIQPYNSNSLQYIIDSSQQKINELNKILESGIKSASDDPAASYLASKLNWQSIQSSSAANNAQTALNFLYAAQNAYSDIIKELNNISNIAKDVIKNNYDKETLQKRQNAITESINKIKNTEENTTFNGVKVFNNSNSADSINSHMFAVVTKEISYDIIDNPDVNRGKDYSTYLSQGVDRYNRISVTQIKNASGDIITLDDNHITISTAEEFISALNSTNTAGKTYYLMENIDLSSLGTLNSSLITNEFKGILEGNGYAISGLQINGEANSISKVGLFSKLGQNASVSNLVLKDFSISGEKMESVGALAGAASNAIMNNISVINFEANAGSRIGGLVGLMDGNNSQISHAIVQANLTGSYEIGGIVGFAPEGKGISFSAFSGDISGDHSIGGIAGHTKLSSINISNSYVNGGTIIGQTKVGGIVGSLENSKITNTYSTAKVIGVSDFGALVGTKDPSGSISNSYAINLDNTISDIETNITGVTSLSAPFSDYILKSENGINYAFVNNTDYQSFISKNNSIAKFYKFDNDTNNWIELSQQLTKDSFSIINLSVNNIKDIPKAGFNFFSSDGTKAFYSQEELNKYDETSDLFRGEIDLYFEKSGDIWAAKEVRTVKPLNIEKLDTIGSQRNFDGYTYTTEVTDASGNNYIYAFSSEEDLNKFKNDSSGNNWYNGYRLNLNGDANTKWEAVIIQNSDNISLDLSMKGVYTRPNDNEAQIYYGDYYFKTEEDKQNFINYQAGKETGAINKFWIKTGVDSWDILSLKGSPTGAYFSKEISRDNYSIPDVVGYEIMYQDPTFVNSSIYAFSSEEDKNAFINYQNGSNLSSRSIDFYEKTSSGWQKKRLSTTGYEVFESGNVIENRPDKEGFDIILGQNSSSFDFQGATYQIYGNYAFKNEIDHNNFNDGINFLNSIDIYFEKQSDGSWKSSSIIGEQKTSYETTLNNQTLIEINYNNQTYSLFGNIKDKAFLSQEDANKYNASQGQFIDSVASYLQQQSDGTWIEMNVLRIQSSEIVFHKTDNVINNTMYDYVSFEDASNDTNRRYFNTFAKYIDNGKEFRIAITDNSAGKYTIDENGYVQINDGESITVKVWNDETRSWSNTKALGVQEIIISYRPTQEMANGILESEYTNQIEWQGHTIRTKPGVVFGENGPTTLANFYMLSEDGTKWEHYESTRKIRYVPYEKNSNGVINLNSPDNNYEKIEIDGKIYAFKNGEQPTSINDLSGVSNFYILNNETNTWDLYTVNSTTNTSYQKVQTEEIVQKSDVVNTNNKIYAFASENDKDIFNNGNPTGSISSYYEYDSVENNWIEKTVLQSSYNGINLVGNNNLSNITNSYLGTGETSRNQTIDGVTFLGNEQIAAGLLNFQNNPAWQNYSDKAPTLVDAPDDNKFNIIDSSLSDLPAGLIIKENINYNTTNEFFNTTLTHSNFTFNSTNKNSTISLSQLNDQYISKVKIYSGSTIFTEGTDYILYAEKNGSQIAWKMNIMSEEMANQSLTFDYEYATQSDAQPGKGGFDIYLGGNGTFNISDMVLDLAGRMNFNVTTKENAQATLSALTGISDYMGLKNLGLDGNINILKLALSNKETQKEIFSNAHDFIMKVDEAALKATLVAEELKRDKAQEFLNYINNINASMVSNLLFNSQNLSLSSDNSFSNLLLGTTKSSNLNLLNTLSSSNSSQNPSLLSTALEYTKNSESNNYFYKNLYDQIKEEWNFLKTS